MKRHYNHPTDIIQQMADASTHTQIKTLMESDQFKLASPKTQRRAMRKAYQEKP